MGHGEPKHVTSLQGKSRGNFDQHIISGCHFLPRALTKRGSKFFGLPMFWPSAPLGRMVEQPSKAQGCWVHKKAKLVGQRDTLLWMDEILHHPKKPKNDSSLVNTNKQWCVMVS